MNTISTINTISVTTEDGQEKTIRVFGHPSDPHFCGKDICEIMEIKDVKDSLFSLVSSDHKTELKNLLKDLNNGPVVPSWLVGFKPSTLLGSVDLKTLSYHDGRLVVLSEPGVQDLLNGTRKDKNKKILRETINKAMYTIKYKDNAGLVDIFSFISKLDLAIDITSDWFQDLWYPLSRSQGSPGATLTKVKNQPIIVTSNLLEWMGYKGEKESFKQLSFSKLLDSLKIPYSEIDHKHPLAIEYPHVQKEVQTIPKNNIERKKWICMEPRAFKKIVMRLNTETSDMVRDYYLNLEEALFAYGEYTMKYMITQREQELAIKDQAESQLKEQLAIKDQQLDQEKERAEKAEKEAKERLERALKFNQATKKVEPREYIYIATTEQYQLETKYKPGGCGSFDLVKSRLSQYNSGKSDSNAHYFVYLRKVVSYRAIEQSLAATLGGFRENANKELYIINFDWLVKCLDAIIDHNEEFLSFVNLHRDQMVEDTMNKAPVIAAPLRLEKIRVSYQRIGEEEIDLTTIFDQETIDAIRNSLTTFNPDNNTIKRMVFENHLIRYYPEIKINHKKRPLWEIVKQIGNSINPKWRYKY